MQYGRFELTRTVSGLIDQETIDSFAGRLDADDEITWRLYVPESYDPARPAGLVVYVSPTHRGGMPVEWQPVFDEQNLIWIGADRSGNRAPSELRMLYTVLAPGVVDDLYRVDPVRVYLAGFSGGGKLAGMIAIHFAPLFRGAIYICGAEFWTDDPPRYFDAVKANRYVFLTGSEDFNLALTRKVHRMYGEAGVSNTSLIVVPGMAHTRPEPRHLLSAIRFLDGGE